MLEIKGLRVTYRGAVEALKGVDLTLSLGEVLAVLGSNGAGKSTLLRAISSTLRHHSGCREAGSIMLDGAPLPDDPARVVKAGVVQVPEGRHIFTRLTVDENLSIGGINRSRAERHDTHDWVLQEFSALERLRQQRAGLLSGGEQQLLAVGRALMAKPRILLLDEPSLGLAPRLVDRLGTVVSRINELGTSILLVEQNAAMALRVAGRAVVFDVGRVALAGTAAEMAGDERVRDLYLGGGAHLDGADGRPGDDPAARRRTLSRWAG
jgi:branched-chain amino acid transport system ATP-binding protein